MKRSSESNKIPRSDITKKKIYEAGWELFGQHGLENVSVDAIVEKAGVAKGTFYIYFASKDALITALAAEHVGKLDIDYHAQIDAFPENAKATDVFFALIDKIAETISIAIGYDMMRLVYSTQLSKTVDTDSISNYSRGVYGTFRQVITKGIKQGEFRADLNADILARHCVLALRGLTYEWCIRYPNFDFREQARQFFDLLLQGMIAQPQNPPPVR